MTPGTYTDYLKAIFDELKSQRAVVDKIAMQVNAIYHDEDPTLSQEKSDDDLTMEERIKKYGQKVSYNMIDDYVEVTKFKDWIYEAKKKGAGRLTDVERDLLDIADKNFDDIRLSSKHLAVLKSINQKLFNRPWTFKSKQGYMYKLEGFQPEWEFFEERV